MKNFAFGAILSMALSALIFVLIRGDNRPITTPIETPITTQEKLPQYQKKFSIPPKNNAAMGEQNSFAKNYAQQNSRPLAKNYKKNTQINLPDAGVDKNNSPCPTDTPWENINPRDEISMIMEGGESRELHAKAIAAISDDLNRTKRLECVYPIEGFSFYKTKIELQLESSNSGIVVAGAKIIESNYGDSEAEACLENSFKDLFIAAENFTDSRYIVDFDLIWHFEDNK